MGGKSMKKKTWNLFLALSLCLTLLPTAALAENERNPAEEQTQFLSGEQKEASAEEREQKEETSAAEFVPLMAENDIAVQSGEHTHFLCGSDPCTENGHAENEETDFQPWTGSDSLPDAPGSYYLTASVTLTEAWKPVDGTILCLNGSSIQAKGSFDVITIEDGITFTVTDCSAGGSGKITHISGDGRGVQVEGTAVFNMYGGDITQNSSSKEGAGINVCGTFNMYGGGITSNTLTAQYNYSGGGVCIGSYASGSGEVLNRIFNMYGGRIAQNVSFNAGGGVDIGSGTFNLYDGSITQNRSRYAGGGVYAGHQKFNMYGGSITENNCSSSSVAGGVYVGQYYWEDARLTVSGDVVIQNNTRGEIADDVYLASPSNYVATVGIGEDGLSNSARIGVFTSIDPAKSAVKIVDTSDVDYSENFFSDEGYYVNYNNSKQLELSQMELVHAHPVCGRTCIHTPVHSTVSVSEWTPVSSGDALCAIDTAGNYYLTDDVTIFTAWEPVDGVVLCLNGKTITMNNCDSAVLMPVIKVTNHFTLTDCKTGNAQGRIMHVAEEDPAKGKGVGVEVFGGTFDMYGGNITGNKADFIYGGSGVAVRDENAFSTGKDGTFNMYGGEISGNQARFGGGVSVMWGAVFHMMGGEISGNSAGFGSTGAYNGGGVYVGHSSTFIMSGGKIKSNTAVDNAGGVYLGAFAKQYTYDTNRAALFQISGDVEITGNTAGDVISNVYLDSSASGENSIRAVITINGELTGKSRSIGIIADDAADGTVVATGSNLTGADLEKFFSDDNGYEIELRLQNLVLKESGSETHTHEWTYTCTSDDTITAKCGADGFSGGSVTITAPKNLIYDGQPKPAALKASSDWQGVGVDSLRIEYQEKLGSGSWTTLSDVPPTGPGTYWAWLRLGGAEAHTEYYTIVKESTGGSSNSSAGSSGSSSDSSSPTYPVTIPSQMVNGTVSADLKNASKGSTVTITVKPESGCSLKTLTVTDSKGNVLKLTDKGNCKYAFTMPAGKVDVNATFTEIPELAPFSDVSADSYYYEAVRWAAEKGIAGGTGNGLFTADQFCTRAQIVTFLWRAAGNPEPKSMTSLSDVPVDAYYAKAVAWAAENKITAGMGDGRFSPNTPCTRAQAVTFLVRALNVECAAKSGFSDVPVDSYYANAVAWAVENGVTNGTTATTFSPNADCTRAQIVTFLWRAYNR